VCARVCNHPCEERCRSGKSGGQPIAIRALKRFITDRFEPPVYTVKHTAGNGRKMPEIAVIGAGPSGLTTAHYLSLAGYKVTIFEAESEPGGMLVCGIPSFRLPREVLKKEIDSLLNENIELKCNICFGKDITLDDLFKKGYKAVYIALGAHKCKRLNIPNEDARGVYPSIQFLKEFNLRSNDLARGRVGVLGGGNSAIDSARVAQRQNGVESVTVLYRRTEQEMPAYREEIEAAVEEGISIETLVSPVEVLVKNGRLARLRCIKNKLGDVDASGRRTPVPIEGSEYIIKLDTLIVAIGEEPETESISQDKIEIDKGKNIKINNETLETNIKGVFAGGDVVTGPNTVVDAVAAGKKAAQIISRYLSGKPLEIPPEIHLPDVYIEPNAENIKKYERTERAVPPGIERAQRCTSFTEVDKSLILEDAVGEAGRCLRCDLEFAQRENVRNGLSVSELKEEQYDHT
jgi:NADH-quinone oxidoreductase subunit F